MTTIINEHLSRITIGERQVYDNMTVFPILDNIPSTKNYLTLKKAMGLGHLQVTETDIEASVSNVKVINSGENPVLLLQGEGIEGAMQNRVFNTTIMLGGKSETIIPVSCTEAGRWSYGSEDNSYYDSDDKPLNPKYSDFHESDVVAPPALRTTLSKTVSHSLIQNAMYDSNQHEVWKDIDDVLERSKVSSDTESMEDVFTEKEEDISGYLDAFPLIPRQKGIIAYVNGTIVGLDTVSREDAYEDYHNKLIRSYALQSTITSNNNINNFAPSDHETFIKKISEYEGKEYASVGLGNDYRLNNDELVGSALTLGGEVIHLNFFPSTSENEVRNV